MQRERRNKEHGCTLQPYALHFAISLLLHNLRTTTEATSLLGRFANVQTYFGHLRALNYTIGQGKQNGYGTHCVFSAFSFALLMDLYHLCV